MADPIIVSIKLEPKDISATAQASAKQFASELEKSMRQAQVRVQQQRAQYVNQLETLERRGALRIEQINAQSAARIQQIEARKQAQLETIRARGLQKEIDNQRKLERETVRASANLNSLRQAASGVSNVFATIAGVGIIGAFAAIGRASIQAAIDIDKQVSVLKALTGSAAAAEKRFQDLFNLAQRTPGLTTNLATTLDVQLRTLDVTEKTINRIIPAIGRLNAVSPIADPNRFTQNLVQLITQNFERADLKELVGQSPLAGVIIREIFKVDSPTNAKAIRESARRLGITTIERLAEEFAREAETNPKLAGAVESLGVRFEKAQERIQISLRPLGVALSEIGIQLLNDLIPAAEQFGSFFAKVFKDNQTEIIETARAIGGIITNVLQLTDEFVRLSGLTPFEAIAKGIRGLTVLFTSFRDLTQLFTAGIKLAFNTIVIEVATLAKNLLGIVGIQFEALNNLITGSTKSAQAAAARLSQGPAATLDVLARFEREDAFRRQSPRQRAISAAIGSGNLTALRIAQQGLEEQGPGLGEGGRPARTGGIGGANAATAAADREAKRLREAQAQFLKERAENDFKIQKDINDRALKNLQELYANSKVTVREFFEFRQTVNLDTINRELALLDMQRLAIEKSLEATGKERLVGDDRIKANKELNDVITEQTLKLAERLDILKQTNIEFIKASQLAQDLPEFRETAIAVPGRRPAIVEQAAEFRRQAEAGGKAADLAEINLRREELRIQQAVEAGALSEGEARQAILAAERQLRDVRLQNLEALRRIEADPKRLADLDLEIEMVQMLGREFSNAEDFLRGFNSQIQTTSDIFEQLGSDIANAFTSTKNLLASLASAVKNFFNSLLASALQLAARSALGGIFGSLFGGGGGAGGAGAATGGGGGGGGIGGILSSIFGGRGGGIAGIGPGGTATTFPMSFAGGGGGGSPFSSILNLVSRGSGISTPASLSQQASILQTAASFSAAGPVGRGNVGLGNIFGGLTSNLFQGFGFGRAAGSARGGLAQAAPLLGLSLGIGAGGMSRAGQIIGGIGGAALGVGLTAAPAALSGTFLAPLFSNPITAVIGGALLVGGILLGKAAQRRKDEEASGQFLTQALQGIDQLAAGIQSGQVDPAQAQQIFESQILGTFIQQINTLKTESVRTSRLTNQVADLRKVYQARIPPLIADQQQQAQQAAAADAALQEQMRREALIFSRLQPQFAGGGVVTGQNRGFDSVRAFLQPGEMVLNQSQQGAVRSMAGANIFRRAGVPGVQMSGTFQGGGIAPAMMMPSSLTSPLLVNIDVQMIVGRDTSRDMFIAGGATESGRRVIVNQMRTTQLNRG